MMCARILPIYVYCQQCNCDQHIYYSIIKILSIVIRKKCINLRCDTFFICIPIHLSDGLAAFYVICGAHRHLYHCHDGIKTHRHACRSKKQLTFIASEIFRLFQRLPCAHIATENRHLHTTHNNNYLTNRCETPTMTDILSLYSIAFLLVHMCLFTVPRCTFSIQKKHREPK